MPGFAAMLNLREVYCRYEDIGTDLFKHTVNREGFLHDGSCSVCSELLPKATLNLDLDSLTCQA